MRAFNIKLQDLTLIGVDDWLCFFSDAEGRKFYFSVECDPLWNDLPADQRRFAMGLGWGTGNRDTAKNRRESEECIAAIGLRKLQLGQRPLPVEVW